MAAERAAAMGRHPAGKLRREVGEVAPARQADPDLSGPVYGTVTAQGDPIGLGMCLHCCGESKAALLRGDTASVVILPAVTLAPYGLPNGGAVAVPCCWQHLAVQRVSPLLAGRPQGQ